MEADNDGRVENRGHGSMSASNAGWPVLSKRVTRERRRDLSSVVSRFRLGGSASGMKGTKDGLAFPDPP